jgi:excisionase family DNA binding protein
MDLAKLAFDTATKIHGVNKMDEPEAYVGTEEAAQILGYHPAFVRELCRQGKLPCHQPRPKAHLRFLVSELRAWMRGEGCEEK